MNSTDQDKKTGKNKTVLIIGVMIVFTIFNGVVFYVIPNMNSNNVEPTSSTMGSMEPTYYAEKSNQPQMEWHFNMRVIDENNTSKNINSQVDGFVACKIPDPANPTIFPVMIPFTKEIQCNQQNMIEFGAVPNTSKLKLDEFETASKGNYIFDSIQLSPSAYTPSFLVPDSSDPFNTDIPISVNLYFMESKN